MFKTMKLGKKLLIAFLLVGVTPAILVGIAAVWEASSALSAQAFNQLEGVRGIKKAQIELAVPQRCCSVEHFFH